MDEVAIGKKQELGKQEAGQLMGTSKAEPELQLMCKDIARDNIKGQGDKHGAQQAEQLRMDMGKAKPEQKLYVSMGKQGAGQIMGTSKAEQMGMGKPEQQLDVNMDKQGAHMAKMAMGQKQEQRATEMDLTWEQQRGTSKAELEQQP